MREGVLAAYSGDSNTISFNALNLKSGTWLYSNGYLARVVMHELAHARQDQVLRADVQLDDNRLVEGLDAETVERWRREQDLYPLLALTYEGHQSLEIEQVADNYADSRMNEYKKKGCLDDGLECRLLEIATSTINERNFRFRPSSRLIPVSHRDTCTKR